MRPRGEVGTFASRLLWYESEAVYLSNLTSILIKSAKRIYLSRRKEKRETKKFVGNVTIIRIYRDKRMNVPLPKGFPGPKTPNPISQFSSL